MEAAALKDFFRGRQDDHAVSKGSIFVRTQQPITEQTYRDHLGGKKGFGFYLLDGDTCLCACVDLDNRDGSGKSFDDARKVYNVLKEIGYEPCVEQSRGGKSEPGAHVWLFWNEPVIARDARSLLTKACLSAGIGVYEIYPKQDSSLGLGQSLGSLVCFPLWGKSKFVDPSNWDEIPLEELELRYSDPPPEVATKPQHSVCVAQGVPDSFAQRMTPGSMLLRKWNGELSPASTDGSRSANLQGIMLEAIRCGVPRKDVLAAARAWCSKEGYERSEEWLTRSLDRSYEFAVQRSQPRPLVIQPQNGIYETTFAQEIGKWKKGEYDQVKEVYGFGIPAMDRYGVGVGDGELLVIGARPSQGKTAFAIQWAVRTAAKVPVLYVTIDMLIHKIVRRFVDGRGYVAVPDTLYMVDGPREVDELCKTLDRYIQQRGVKLVIIDTFNKLTINGSIVNDRVIAGKAVDAVVSYLRSRLIAVSILCQLHRGDPRAKPEDTHPKASDLKETGALEENADRVLLLSWPWHPMSGIKSRPEESWLPNQYLTYPCKVRDECPQKFIPIHFDANRQEFR